MRLDPRSTIAGFPALEIRRLLRALHGDPWPIARIAEVLHCSTRSARTVATQLASLDYLEVAVGKGRVPHYRLTIAGAALGLASAALPLRRRSAERILREFLARVEVVNASRYYLYRVSRVGVFGSYLSSADRLNDIDIALTLRPVEAEHATQWQLEKVRIAEARANGRRFPNISSEYFWATAEVLLFLKSRSRALSLHVDDPILERVSVVPVYEEARGILEPLP